MNEFLIRLAQYLGYKNIDEDTLEFKDENGYWTSLGALIQDGLMGALNKASTDDYVSDVCHNFSTKYCTICVNNKVSSITIAGHGEDAIIDCLTLYFKWLDENGYD